MFTMAAVIQIWHGVKVGPGPQDPRTRDPPQSLKVGLKDLLQNLKVGPQDPLKSLKVGIALLILF